MPKFIVSLAATVLMTLSGAAEACTLFPDSPEEIFRRQRASIVPLTRCWAG